MKQGQRLRGYLPRSHYEYIEQRLFSSAVYPCFFGLEYVWFGFCRWWLAGEMYADDSVHRLFFDYRLPDWVLDSDEMKLIMREGNYVISV